MTSPVTDTLLKLGALGTIVAVAAGTGHVAEEIPYAAPLTALGLFLLTGELFAELGERAGLPHLTGYLAAGIALGPHGLGLVAPATVERLMPINTLALALIALSAGGELTLSLLKRSVRSLGWATLAQLAIAAPLIAVGFFAMKPLLPFLDGMSTGAVAAVALLWAVLALSRSPAATLGLIAELRPDGPLTRYSLAVVVAFDIIVLLLFSLAMPVVCAVVEPGSASIGLAALEETGLAMVGSVAAGTTVGLLVTAYLKLVGRHLTLFLLLLAYGVTSLATYLGYDSLLLFVVAGFIVANVSRSGGELLLETVSQGGQVVYVVFFAVAGAQLDLGLLAVVWPAALGLVGARIVATALACNLGSRIARDPAPVRRLGWMPLVSQAGVTLGMAVVVSETFATSLGPALQGMVVAVVGINQVIGPILFKLSLDRAGEVRPQRQEADAPPGDLPDAAAQAATSLSAQLPTDPAKAEAPLSAGSKQEPFDSVG